MNIIGRLVMRPPILLVRSCFFVIFFGSLLFLIERPFIAFSGIPGWNISRFYFLWILSVTNCFYPLGL